MAAHRRPLGITLLASFFLFGVLMGFAASASLLFPGSALEPMWRANPDARAGLAHLGRWAALLMGVVGAACALSAVGLWTGARWGYRLAVYVLVANLVGDTGSAVVRHDPRTLIGIPIALLMILYLLRHGRAHRGTQPG